MPIKRILVPTDLSDLSLSSIEYASSLALFFKAEMYVMHVMDNEPLLAIGMIDANAEEIIRAIEQKSKNEMSRFFSKKITRGRSISCIVRRGNPYEEIVKFSNEEQIDLIVISTHGRSGLAKILLGSVAEKVVRYSSVPVLTVKPNAAYKANSKAVESVETI